MPRKKKSETRSPEHAALGQAVEVLIAANTHMTQESVASDAGLTPKQVREIMRGRGNPTYASLMKLCQGLHVLPDQLLALARDLQDKSSGR